jgi:hypothetical protein
MRQLLCLTSCVWLGAALLASPMPAKSAMSAHALTLSDDDASNSTRNRDDLLRQPERPLDERINTERIKETQLPPLPQQVVLPKPPEHRIADDPSLVPISEEHYKRAHAAMMSGLAWLREAQHESGGWMHQQRTTPTDQPDAPSPIAVAVTALAVKAIVQADASALETDADVWRALRYVRRTQQENGAFEGGALTNYVTSSVVMALAAMDDPDLQDNIRDALQWLQSNQWDQEQGVRPEHDWFGGAGYGNHGRPDMSNTQMMLDAMYDAGMSPDEPAFQRALAFLSRAQNLSETNPSEWAGDDGGFVYTPAGGGESMASEAAGEGRRGELLPADQPRSLRSYGSMTYAGFKSMMYAGLSPDDIRVRAAFDWVRRHWTFDENPGMGLQGLYYYYHAMARALNVAQQHTIEDIDGQSHNWREELIDEILARQQDNGSWKNEADRWLEGEDVMATVYALLSLQEALKPAIVAE